MITNPFELLSERLDFIESLLLDLKNQNSVAPSLNADQWFKLPELQSYLPEKPAKPTVYEWVGKRIIPYHRRGKKLYFLKSEIDQWLRASKRKTASDLAHEADLYLKNATRTQ